MSVLSKETLAHRAALKSAYRQRHREKIRARDREAYKKNYPKNRARKNELRRKAREANIERYRASERTRNKKENRPRYLLQRAALRAKKIGVPFNLKIEDIQIPTICPVLGIKLDQGPRSTWSTLDRLSPARGYVRGNVYVISFRANSIKSDATISELVAIVSYMCSGGVYHAKNISAE